MKYYICLGEDDKFVLVRDDEKDDFGSVTELYYRKDFLPPRYVWSLTVLARDFEEFDMSMIDRFEPEYASEVIKRLI